MSFRKKLYKYLGMKADMQAYARAIKAQDKYESKPKKQTNRKVEVNTQLSCDRNKLLVGV